MVNKKYIVVFKDKKQKTYYDKDIFNINDIENNEIYKEIKFDPEKNICSLDKNDNIILTVKQNIIDTQAPDQRSDYKKFLQYMMAYLVKNNIIYYSNLVVEGKLSEDKFNSKIEESLNFKIDEVYNELFS